MTDRPELWAALIPVVNVLESLKVAYYVGDSGRCPRAPEAMVRRIPLEVPEAGRVLDFCASEDIVLSKLQWYKARRSGIGSPVV